MARFALIALLTVVAVAWPVTAQGIPIQGLPDLDDPLVGVDDDGVFATAAACRIYKLAWDPSEGPLPDFDLRVDPDGCVRKLVDDVWPFWPTFSNEERSDDDVEAEAPNPESDESS